MRMNEVTKGLVLGAIITALAIGVAGCDSLGSMAGSAIGGGVPGVPGGGKEIGKSGISVNDAVNAVDTADKINRAVNQ